MGEIKKVSCLRKHYSPRTSICIILTLTLCNLYTALYPVITEGFAIKKRDLSKINLKESNKKQTALKASEGTKATINLSDRVKLYRMLFNEFHCCVLYFLRIEKLQV